MMFVNIFDTDHAMMLMNIHNSMTPLNNVLEHFRSMVEKRFVFGCL